VRHTPLTVPCQVQLSEVMAKQIPDEQLQTLSHIPLRRTDYAPGDCQKEMQFHLQWRAQSRYPLKKVTGASAANKDANHHRVKDSVHEPMMCAEYLQAVANSPISLANLTGLPPLKDLIRP